MVSLSDGQRSDIAQASEEPAILIAGIKKSPLGNTMSPGGLRFCAEIVCYVGRREAEPILVEGLRRLEYLMGHRTECRRCQGPGRRTGSTHYR
jgi:hypothetical protein